MGWQDSFQPEQPVNKRLLNSLANVESGGNPNALSPKGAAGTYQIMPATARDPGFGVRPLQGWDGQDPRTAPPQEQERFANEYLGSQINRYGDTSMGLAAYNAGAGNVDNALQKTGGNTQLALNNLPRETQNYVPKVLAGAGQKPSWRDSFQPAAPQVSIRPEEMPAGHYLANMPDLTIPENLAARMPANAVAQQPDFYQRVGQRMLERGQNVAGDVVRTATGQNSIPETAMNYLGNSAGLLFDVGGELAKSAFDVLPSPVQQGIKATPNLLAQSPLVSSSLKAGGELATQAMEKGNELAQQYPDTARRYGNQLENIFNLSGLPIAGKAAEATASVVKPIAEDITSAIRTPQRAVPQKAVKLEPITPTDLAQAKNNAYKYTLDTGSGIDGNGSALLVDKVSKYRKAPQFEGTFLSKTQADINDAIDKIGNIKGKKGSIEGIQELDSDLGDKIADAYISGNKNKGRILSNMQDDLRETLTSPEMRKHAIGTPEGIDTLFNHAIPLAAAEFRLKDITKIIDKGMSTTTPSRSVKTGLNNYIANEKKFRVLPKEVQAEVRKAAKSGNADDLLSIIGSRLNAVAGGASSGIKGAAIGYGIGKAARTISEKMTLNKTNKIYKSLLEPVRGSVERFKTMPEVPQAPMKLLEYRPPATDIQVGAQGAKKLSVKEQMALNKARANKESLGGKVDRITPEQRKLLAGIQRGANGVAKVKTEAAIAKPLPAAIDKTPRKVLTEFNNSGKPTSVYTFIRNNGGLKSDGGDLKAMGFKDLINDTRGIPLNKLGEKLEQAGFTGFESGQWTNDTVTKLLSETNGGRKAYAPKDVDRVMTAQESAAAKNLNDPSYIEYVADNMGIDTQGKTTQQLLKEIEKLQMQLQDIPF